MKLRLLLATCLLSSTAYGQEADWLINTPSIQPFKVELNEKERVNRITGTIVLTDPIYNTVLGKYEFVSGGFHSRDFGGSSEDFTSMPFGEYAIGDYRDEKDDRLGIGKRWMLRQRAGVLTKDGEAIDVGEKSRKVYKRTNIELHSSHHSTGSQGCMTVLGGPNVWNDFIRNMNYIMAQIGSVFFKVDGNPNPTGKVIPFESYSAYQAKYYNRHPVKKKLKKEVQHHYKRKKSNG